ncbi:hypothetical protein HZA56_15175 [Candidatus Poribacteria bacterium]|nr:hypothetical protein [Candidatus Poribacteria bacterium]
MEKLKKELDKLIEKLENADDFRLILERLISVYPFSEYEYVISHLLAARKLTLDEYHDLRISYIDRNLYLYIFEISAPRGFGDKWAFGHLKELVPEFQRPSKKLDPKYSGEYDFWLDLSDKGNKSYGIRIEIKTSRAVDYERPDEPLYIKALPSDSDRPFDMNFQQIKTKCADVFLWIAVWRDKIRYWVLCSDEVQNNKYFSKRQHRGNVGEGQLHFNRENIFEFDRYEVKSTRIKNAVVEAYKRQKEIG